MAELSTLGAVVKVAVEGMFSGAYSDLTGRPTLSAAALSGSYADLLGKPSLDFVPLTQKGANNGVAPLDAAGLVPLVHLNVGGLSFKGAWNPATNSPQLVDGTGSVGDFYKASVAGTRNTGNGSFTYAVGDWVIFAGGTWQRLGSTDAVAMVNGKLGNVTLTATDVGAKAASYVPAWSEVTGKPTLTNSVNGQSGAVVLSAADVGAVPDTYIPAWSAVTGKPSLVNTVNGQSGAVVIAPPQLSYTDRLGSRVATTWYTNTSQYDRIVNISTNYVAASSSSLIAMRAPGTTTPVFSARSHAIGTGDSNQIMQAIVPAGWEYRFVPGASRTVSTWFEGDYE